MAAYDIQFADPGGEYYYGAGATAAGVWNGGGNATLVNNAPAGRATQYAFEYSTNLIRVLGGNYQNWIIGAAVYNFGTNTGQLALRDGTTIQISVGVNASNAFTVSRGSTLLGQSANNVYVPGGWQYVEIKATIAGGTSGSVEIRVNGAVVLTLTGVNTSNTGNAYASQFYYSHTQSATYLKDLYVMADTGAGPYATYLGDITVAVFYPNGAGVNSAWTANGAASGWQCTDDNPASGTAPDGDTTYISSATAGQISDFSHAALSLTGSIYGVIVASYQRKDDAGSRSAANTLLSGGTESDGATQALGNTYQYFFDVYEKDPHTSAAWTLTGFNSMTFGVKEIS